MAHRALARIWTSLLFGRARRVASLHEDEGVGQAKSPSIGPALLADAHVSHGSFSASGSGALPRTTARARFSLSLSICTRSRIAQSRH